MKNKTQNDLAIKPRSISSAMPGNRNRNSLVNGEESKQLGTQDFSDNNIMTMNKKGEKVMITGDDILIEYCDRLMNAIK